MKTFVRKLARFYSPITYRKALEWVHQGRLPIWPRLRNENINVKVPDLHHFCRNLGIEDEKIQILLRDICS